MVSEEVSATVLRKGYDPNLAEEPALCFSAVRVDMLIAHFQSMMLLSSFPSTLSSTCSIRYNNNARRSLPWWLHGLPSM